MGDIFQLLVLKLIPLYVVILLGFLAGRVLRVDRDSVANILFYLILPIVIFHGVVKTHLTVANLFLPLLTFTLSCLIGGAVYLVSRRIWNDATPNILALAGGTGNTGYFGLPVALALFDQQTVGLYIVAMMGITLFESSVGFFIAARGHHTLQESVKKVMRLPTLYAFIAGAALSFANLPIPIILEDFALNMRATYVVLGMMIIGLGLARMQRFSMDFGFTAIAFAAKFIVWPAVTLLLVYMDRSFLHFYSEPIHQALLLLSIVPMAANTVAIAAVLNTHPEKAAAAVLVSTILAVVYVPLMVSFFIIH